MITALGIVGYHILKWDLPDKDMVNLSVLVYQKGMKISSSYIEYICMQDRISLTKIKIKNYNT